MSKIPTWYTNTIVGAGNMQTLTLDAATPFSADATLSCGQCFRWKKTDGWWYGVAGGTAIRLRQEGPVLWYEGCTERFLRHYLALDFSLPEMYANINADDIIDRAILNYTGLRILRQDSWECLVSFLCSQNTQIPNITRMVENIAALAGSIKTEDAAACTASFPSPEQLAACSCDEIRVCRTGYRAGYLQQAANYCAENPDWTDSICALPYREARAKLLKFHGVGRKVADCVLLFGFEKYEAFPVDVWMKEIMQRCYGTCSTGKSLTPAAYDVIGDWARSYFGLYAGYAQEYLFASRNEICKKE